MVTDRHGRASRADNDPRRRPSDGYRVATTARFRRIVESAVAALPARLAEPLAGARLIVAEVPPEPGVTADGDVVLATFGGDVLTVYRRPVESRADSRAALEETLMLAIGEAVAASLGYGGDIGDLFD